MDGVFSLFPFSDTVRLKSRTTLRLFHIFMRLLSSFWLGKVFVHLCNSFVRLKSNQRIYSAHSSVTCQKKKQKKKQKKMIWREGCFCSTYAANSPSESATLLLCLRPLYDFCNEITVCFPDQWVLLIVLATFLFFQFKVSSIHYVYPEQQH